jgi:hypothetical protein
MEIVIRNDGLITLTIWDETHSLLNYAKPSDATPPYDLELIWYTKLLDEIYESYSSYLGITATGVMDGVRMLGTISMETSYGYVVQGSQAANQKMKITITHP